MPTQKIGVVSKTVKVARQMTAIAKPPKVARARKAPKSLSPSKKAR